MAKAPKRRPAGDGLLGNLVGRGWRQGALGGSKAWTYVGVAALALRLGRRILTTDELVYRTVLRKGEGLEIVQIPHVSRRARTRAARD